MFYDISLCLVNPISSQYIQQKKEVVDIVAPDNVFHTNIIPKIVFNDNNNVDYNVDYNENDIEYCDDSDNDFDFNDLSDTFTSKYLYESEILHALNMNKYDEEITNTKMINLYNYICNMREINPTAELFLSYAQKLSTTILLNDDEYSGFIMFFSYHFFHITHLCISNLLDLDNQYISNTNIECFINTIESFISSDTNHNNNNIGSSFTKSNLDLDLDLELGLRSESESESEPLCDYVID
jgi:hypothetical protein